jgi:hypothetical protein
MTLLPLFLSHFFSTPLSNHSILFYQPYRVIKRGNNIKYNKNRAVLQPTLYSHTTIMYEEIHDTTVDNETSCLAVYPSFRNNLQSYSPFFKKKHSTSSTKCHSSDLPNQTSSH